MNRISDSEREALNDWLSSDPKNHQKFEEAKQVWELTGSDGEPVYDLEEEKQKVLQSIKNNQASLVNSKPSYGFKTINLLIRAAAAIFLIITTAYFTRIYVSHNTFSNSTGAILVSHESMSKIDLPDSSIVYLNKKSNISFSQNSENRTVQLKGEAFFEVEKDKRPFIINVQGITIKVLGTSFNVRAFEDENEVRITITSGRVEILDGLKSIQLSSGEKAVFNRLKNTLETSLNTDPNFMAWKTQRLVFRNMELKNVIYALSEYYDVTFKIKTPIILDCKFTGSFDKARLETVMEVLAYSLGLEYYYDRDQYILSGSQCE